MPKRAKSGPTAPAAQPPRARPPRPAQYGDPAKALSPQQILDELGRIAFLHVGVRNRRARDWWALKLRALDSLAKYHQMFRDPLAQQLEHAIREQLGKIASTRAALAASGVDTPQGLLLPPAPGEIAGVPGADSPPVLARSSSPVAPLDTPPVAPLLAEARELLRDARALAGDEDPTG